MGRCTLEVEAALLSGGATLVAGMDEVGRGSVFGPCCVGVVVIDDVESQAPDGVDDSKALSPRRRSELVSPILVWARDCAVGVATALEIDTFGLTAALRLAGMRALAQLRRTPDVVVLDGSFDWLTPPAPALVDPPYPLVGPLEVRTVVRGDTTCATVAAASVVAKVHRDRVIEEMSARFPGYDLARNKGYATPAHLEGLRRLGPSIEHRRSWNLPARDKVEN